MSLMRPGVKIKLWKFGAKNKSHVHPPGLLRLVAALSILSTVGVLVYSVFQATTWIGYTGMAAEKAAYIAMLHFVLPFCVFYAVSTNRVSTNSILSRFLIAAYSLVLYVATISGKGFLGELSADSETGLVIASAAILLILVWLFRSPKMRLYYVLIAGKPVPEDLKYRASELVGGNRLSAKNRARVEWIIDNVETAIIFGFIIVVFIAFLSTG